MRLSVSLLLFALAGISFAQDTSFSAGPQYLITTGSPMLLRPIATPTMSISSAIPDPYISATELAPSVTGSSPQTNPENGYLGEVYWGEQRPSEIVERRIETPSMTAEETAYYTYATANLASTPFPEPATVPVFAATNPMIIEITSAQFPANLPASIFDPGVTAVANSQSLLTKGYGMSLGDLARYWKSNKRRATHVFTNEDLHRR